ncbi:hypothetical protein Tco_0095582, partial [Tanacetum coccineum]
AESTDVLAPTPLHSVPGATAESPRLDPTSVGSSEDADVAGAESEAGEVDSGLVCDYHYWVRLEISAQSFGGEY